MPLAPEDPFLLGVIAVNNDVLGRIDAQAQKRLLTIYQTERDALLHKIGQMASADTFGARHKAVIVKALDEAVKRLEAEIGGVHEAAVDDAAQAGAEGGLAEVGKLEGAFGEAAAARTLASLSAVVPHRAIAQVHDLVAFETKNLTVEMSTAVKAIVQRALVQGRNSEQAIPELVAAAGGALEQKRWQIERTLRTGLNAAVNRGHNEGYREAQELLPDLKRQAHEFLKAAQKIRGKGRINHPFSFVVHGAIAELDGPWKVESPVFPVMFWTREGAFYVGMHYPAHLYDRGRQVPWRAAWQSKTSPQALTPGEVFKPKAQPPVPPPAAPAPPVPVEKPPSPGPAPAPVVTDLGPTAAEVQAQAEAAAGALGAKQQLVVKRNALKGKLDALEVKYQGKKTGHYFAQKAAHKKAIAALDQQIAGFDAQAAAIAHAEPPALPAPPTATQAKALKAQKADLIKVVGTADHETKEQALEAIHEIDKKLGQAPAPKKKPVAPPAAAPTAQTLPELKAQLTDQLAALEAKYPDKKTGHYFAQKKALKAQLADVDAQLGPIESAKFQAAPSPAPAPTLDEKIAGWKLQGLDDLKAEKDVLVKAALQAAPGSAAETDLMEAIGELNKVMQDKAPKGPFAAELIIDYSKLPDLPLYPAASTVEIHLAKVQAIIDAMHAEGVDIGAWAKKLEDLQAAKTKALAYAAAQAKANPLAAKFWELSSEDLDEKLVLAQELAGLLPESAWPGQVKLLTEKLAAKAAPAVKAVAFPEGIWANELKAQQAILEAAKLPLDLADVAQDADTTLGLYANLSDTAADYKIGKAATLNQKLMAKQAQLKYAAAQKMPPEVLAQFDTQIAALKAEIEGLGFIPYEPDLDLPGLLPKAAPPLAPPPPAAAPAAPAPKKLTDKGYAKALEEIAKNQTWAGQFTASKGWYEQKVAEWTAKLETHAQALEAELATAKFKAKKAKLGEALAKVKADLATIKGGPAPLAPSAPPAPPKLQPLPGKGAPPDLAAAKQTGGQKGSNLGGEFTDAQGQKWYVKAVTDEDRAKNEILAAEFYRASGLDAPEVHLLDFNGTIEGRAHRGKVIASKIIDGLKQDKAAITTKALEGIAEGFATDAWLANWDVVGLSYDNLLVLGNRVVRVDTGGALLYRAQGSLKGSKFGTVVGELDTLRDTSLNGASAAVFGRLTDDQVMRSIERVLVIDDQTIRNLVDAHGPGDAAAKRQLADILIARRENLRAQLAAMKQANQPIVITPKKARQDITPDEAKKIAESGIGGRVVLSDLDQIEDQHLLFWEEATTGGAQVANVALRLHGKAGNDPLMALVKAADQGKTTPIPFRRMAAKWSGKTVTGGQAINTGRTVLTKGELYEAKVNGLTIRYWPDTTATKFAFRGRLEIQGARAGAEGQQDILDLLETLGIDTHAPTRLEREDLYLRQIAYVARPKKIAEFDRALAGKTDPAERVAAAKAWLQRELGKDVTKSPSYNPMGVHQGGGTRERVILMRPDLDGDPEWEAFQRDYVLVHRNTSSQSMPDLVSNILEAGGSLASTTDRLRRGLWMSTMSPDSDIESGGASYVFTRIRKRSSIGSGTFVWRGSQIGRLDSISYGHDLFGRTTGSTVIDNRTTDVAGWKANAGNSSNETNFKNGLSLFDDLEAIMVGSKAEQAAVIATFKKHGINQWPDGRRLEDVVKVG